MAVDTTFSSILNEIQLSNLNFTIQMTPYAAYITLKKSSLKYQDGSYAVPSPPILTLLQEARHVIGIQKTEILELQASCAILRTKVNDVVLDNASLMDKLKYSNEAFEASDNLNISLQDKIEKVENELAKVYADRNILETKVKELKKNHSNEITYLRNEINSIKKSNKSKEKENYDQKRTIEAARDTIKNQKAKVSNATICKTKLEAEDSMAARCHKCV